MSHAIGLDLGGSNLRAAVVDESGNVLRAARKPLSDRSPEGCLRVIAELLHALAPLEPHWPLGVGFAGQINSASECVALSPNLGWRDVPFAQMLRQRFGRPTYLTNDLNAIAYGECVRGAGQGSKHLLCVYVGTGVGMGAVCDGSLFLGSRGYATELGHTKMASPMAGRQCGCGERGCLEAYTSGRHLPELLAAVVQAGADTSIPLDGTVALSATLIEEAFEQGDAAARALWGQISERLAMAIGNAVTLFNPEVLVLGGGVLMAAPCLHDLVVQSLPQIIGAPEQEGLTICKTQLGDNAGLVGAALLSLKI